MGNVKKALKRKARITALKTAMIVVLLRYDRRIRKKIIHRMTERRNVMRNLQEVWKKIVRF